MEDIASTVPSTSDGRTEPVHSPHARHCFVVMPSGRDAADQKWFRGWYEVVIKPAVVEAGYDSILAAAEEQPGAINDEIRAHLALDPMVVVDLGGSEPEDDPNPNVMYELGIRHALGLPLVMMAWKGQRLPFDVSNQRVIMEERDLMDLEQNRRKLVSFVHAAEQGKYYKPMEAVSRQATIQVASESLGEDSVLRALALEVRELRTTVAAGMRPKRFPKNEPPTHITIKKILNGKAFRKELYPFFIEAGGTSKTWARVLGHRVTIEEGNSLQSWGVEQWKAYLTERTNGPQPQEDSDLDQATVDQVRQLLPSQPWPQAIHVSIAEKLGINEKLASRCIGHLIKLGIFQKQVGGKVIPPVDISQSDSVSPSTDTISQS